MSGICRFSIISYVDKSSTLISKFAEFEEKQRQLNLDLELAQQNLKKAQDEAAGMEGN